MKLIRVKSSSSYNGLLSISRSHFDVLGYTGEMNKMTNYVLGTEDKVLYNMQYIL